MNHILRLAKHDHVVKPAVAVLCFSKRGKVTSLLIAYSRFFNDCGLSLCLGKILVHFDNAFSGESLGFGLLGAMNDIRYERLQIWLKFAHLHFTMPLAASHSRTVMVMVPSEQRMLFPGAKSTASFG